MPKGKTEMDVADQAGGSYTDADITGRVSMARFASSDDVSRAIAFLADEPESGFVNGHALSVDGGWSADGTWESLRQRKRCVAQVQIPSGEEVIIGMDILGLGDFSVTHFGGETVFSFCVPSRKCIDFVQDIGSFNKSHPPSRNAPCSCKSGKNYKSCCGCRRR